MIQYLRVEKEYMTQKELTQWYELRQQVVNGWHMSDQDKQDLIRLNHLVMEASHKIHNDNMISKEKNTVQKIVSLNPDTYKTMSFEKATIEHHNYIVNCIAGNISEIKKFKEWLTTEI